jgi:hypothetical protein
MFCYYIYISQMTLYQVTNKLKKMVKLVFLPEVPKGKKVCMYLDVIKGKSARSQPYIRSSFDLKEQKYKVGLYDHTNSIAIEQFGNKRTLAIKILRYWAGFIQSNQKFDKLRFQFKWNSSGTSSLEDSIDAHGTWSNGSPQVIKRDKLHIEFWATFKLWMSMLVRSVQDGGLPEAEEEESDSSKSKVLTVLVNNLVTKEAYGSLNQLKLASSTTQKQIENNARVRARNQELVRLLLVNFYLRAAKENPGVGEMQSSNFLLEITTSSESFKFMIRELIPKKYVHTFTRYALVKNKHARVISHETKSTDSPEQVLNQYLGREASSLIEYAKRSTDKFKIGISYYGGIMVQDYLVHNVLSDSEWQVNAYVKMKTTDNWQTWRMRDTNMQLESEYENDTEIMRQKSKQALLTAHKALKEWVIKMLK